ncbi:hypothetical protein BDD12DRAFT_912199 [Trichophaea hybrida]|nr:hypothetical protein BDD12DRAFT_912199 [Trichophaea hybrida]
MCFSLITNHKGILLPRLLTQSEFTTYLQYAEQPLDELLTEPWYYYYSFDWDKDSMLNYLVPWNFASNSGGEVEECVVATSAGSQFDKEGDGRCKISGYAVGLESAHLVPKEEVTWYCASTMSVYATNQQMPE